MKLILVSNFFFFQREQLASHEGKLAQLTNDLAEHKRNPPPTKGLQLQNYIEKDQYLQYEVSGHLSIVQNKDLNFFFFFFQVKRYKTYVNILSAPQQGDQPNNFQNNIAEETKILNLQSQIGVNESNVNYYHQPSTDQMNRFTGNRTTPHYRSNADDKFELANF